MRRPAYLGNEAKVRHPKDGYSRRGLAKSWPEERSRSQDWPHTRSNFRQKPREHSQAIHLSSASSRGSESDGHPPRMAEMESGRPYHKVFSRGLAHISVRVYTTITAYTTAGHIIPAFVDETVPVLEQPSRCTSYKSFFEGIVSLRQLKKIQTHLTAVSKNSDGKLPATVRGNFK